MSVVRACVLVALALGCRRPTKAPAAPPRVVSGLYWGRWEAVPEGIRVRVWLDGSARSLRGAWELPPWHGEIGGTRAPDGRGYDVDWREEGVVNVLEARTRRVRLRVDDATGALRGDGVELVPAGHPSPSLRPGMWLSRWTGLPHGMAVETVLSRTPDGRWRAAYQYQQREGSFDGDEVQGALAIRWREVSSQGNVSSGAGLLRPETTGLQGTYGVGGEGSGTGFWSLEPLPPGPASDPPR